MSIASEIFAVTRKIFLVSDHLNRVTAKTEELSRIAHEHDVRMSVIENTLAISNRSRLILPGK